VQRDSRSRFVRLWARGLLVVLLAVTGAHAAGEKRVRKPAPKPPTVPSAPADTTGSSAVTATDSGAAGSAVPGLPGTEADRTLRRKTVAYDLVRFGQNVHIHADELVRGDVVLLGGDLRVEGEIAGGAVVLGGSIDIGSQARIGGEAISVGGRVDADTGADVRGGTVSLSFLPAPLASGGDWQRTRHIAALVGDLVGGGLLLLFAELSALLGARWLRRAGDEIGRAFWRCIGLGVLVATGGLFSVVMLIVLLALTLIGLPLSLLLALATLWFLAAAEVAGLTWFGAGLATMLRFRAGSVRAAAALGVAALFAPKIIADLLRVAGLEFAGTSLRFTHGAVMIAALACGLGALVLSRFGARQTAPRLGPALGAPSIVAGAVVRPSAGD
jgi:hypothetical protein